MSKSAWEKKRDWERKLAYKKRDKKLVPKWIHNGSFNKLKSTRLWMGYTQAEVAKKAGISVRTYQSYEQEQRYPKISTAIKITEILGYNCEYLWGTPEFAGRARNDKRLKNDPERKALIYRLQELKENDPGYDHKQLKKYRLFLGYTQEEFAEKIGVTLATYQSYEQNLHEPNVLVAIDIAYYLGKHCYALWGVNRIRREFYW